MSSPCAREIFTRHWPKGQDDFDSAMRDIQAALIRCYLPRMRRDDKRRATETLLWLEKGGRRCN